MALVRHVRIFAKRITLIYYMQILLPDLKVVSFSTNYLRLRKLFVYERGCIFAELSVRLICISFVWQLGRNIEAYFESRRVATCAALDSLTFCDRLNSFSQEFLLLPGNESLDAPSPAFSKVSRTLIINNRAVRFSCF
jgi:hypothetical protein